MTSGTDAYLLAIDGGQTETRALLARVEGTILGEGLSTPIRHMFADTEREACVAIQGAIIAAYKEAGMGPGTVAAVGCGVTSVEPDGSERAKVERYVREIVRAESVAVVPDYVMNLLGASSGKPGVVVVAGGGSVAYGRTHDGREAVAGGFGYLLGDEGGGYSIGQRAVGAAIRATDGRGITTVLEEIVKEAFDLTDLRQIKRVVYTPEFSRGRLAALVPLVARAAREGDGAAQEIMATAARELAELALAVIGKLFRLEEPVGAYPTGGVFRSGDVIGKPFEEAVYAAWPGVDIRRPAGPPILGALILARQLLGLPVDADWLRHIRTGPAGTRI